MSIASGTAVENSLLGGSILYTDTGTYGAVTSRILTIYDYQGNIVTTINMGATLTATLTFPVDAWFHFQCVVIDNTGTLTADVYLVAVGYYWFAYQNQYNASACGCNGNNSNLVISQLALASSLRSNLAGTTGAAVAQRDIVAANYFANQSIIAQY
jgi:hypothetical protein